MARATIKKRPPVKSAHVRSNNERATSAPAKSRAPGARARAVKGGQTPQKFNLTLNATRDVLIKACEEISLNPLSVTFLAAAISKPILVQIIDQLPPRRDPRFNPDAWRVAMLASELVKRKCAKVELAVLISIQTFYPGKENDQAFRENCMRRYRKLRRNPTAAAGQLLWPNDEIVQGAIELLRNGKQ